MGNLSGGSFIGNVIGRVSIDEVAEFCASEYPRLVGSLALYTGDRHLAEVCAQEALTVAVRDWPKLARMERPGPYVHRVAINVANGHYRRLKVRRRVEQRLAAGLSEIEQTTEISDAVVLREAVAALPRRRRAVVVLRFQAGLNLAEIAEVLGISVGTVKSQLHRALAALRTTIVNAEEEAHVDRA